MNIHPTAILEPGVEIGTNVEVGPYSIIRSGVSVGSGTKIGSFCEIGLQPGGAEDLALIIGDNSNIRSHCVLYSGSEFASGLETGHHVTIRENTKAGLNFRVGTLSDIQGDVVIRDYVRFHSNVFVAKGTQISDFVWVFPHVVFTNDPTPPSNMVSGCSVDEYAVIAARSVILPGVRIGRGSLVGAGSTVTRDVAPDTIVVGNPAIDRGPTSRISLRSDGGKAYPWRRHFHRGYPSELVARWIDETDE